MESNLRRQQLYLEVIWVAVHVNKEFSFQVSLMRGLKLEALKKRVSETNVNNNSVCWKVKRLNQEK